MSADEIIRTDQEERDWQQQLDRLLSQTYQRKQHRSLLHNHVCQGCDVELTCCCGDRRWIDRVTGSPRIFFCVECQEYKHELEELEKFMASENAKDATPGNEPC